MAKRRKRPACPICGLTNCAGPVPVRSSKRGPMRIVSFHPAGQALVPVDAMTGWFEPKDPAQAKRAIAKARAEGKPIRLTLDRKTLKPK